MVSGPTQRRDVGHHGGSSTRSTRSNGGGPPEAPRGPQRKTGGSGCARRAARWWDRECPYSVVYRRLNRKCDHATDSVRLVKSNLGAYACSVPGSILHADPLSLAPPTMLPNSMTSRPADLVDFDSPPVTEVVLGVQFNSLERFLSPHLGIVWNEFKEGFPLVEEHPYFPPAFETFGTPAAFMIPSVNFQILTRPEMLRVHFLNQQKTQLLQVQRDRFLHNWRKVGSGDTYPRFEGMIETFEFGFRKFADAIDREELGSVVPNQCEVSYFNQIPIPDSETIWSKLASTFPHCAGSATIEGLGPPEDARFAMRYIIRAADGNALGRVAVAAEPARRADGVTIIQFTLTARGKPATADMKGVVEFLKNGRVLLNRVFKKLTSAEMQKQWRKKQ